MLKLMAETDQGATECNVQAMSGVCATAVIDLTEKWCKKYDAYHHTVCSKGHLVSLKSLYLHIQIF
jgi:hypothetical protein